jgi:oligopeptidase B
MPFPANVIPRSRPPGDEESAVRRHGLKRGRLGIESVRLSNLAKVVPMNEFYFRHVYFALVILAFLVLASVFVLPAADNSSLPTPPVAKKEPKITEINGHKMVDNYYWLREKTNPDVKAYLEAENVYTDAVMKPTEPLQKKLYGEMLSRIKETDVEVPYKEGGYFYYLRTEAGKQYGIRCRKK